MALYDSFCTLPLFWGIYTTTRLSVHQKKLPDGVTVSISAFQSVDVHIRSAGVPGSIPGRGGFFFCLCECSEHPRRRHSALNSAPLGLLFTRWQL